MPARNLRAAVFAAALGLSTLAHADDLGGKLRSKLQQPFAGNVEWVTDYEEALRQAKKEGKLVFAYFTRSYYP